MSTRLFPRRTAGSRFWDNGRVTLTTAPAPALRIGPIGLPAPVVLAPMAGITNTAFRRLCREYGAGLYVSEMITTRALVERNATTMRLIRHHESETPRSIQLYGVDPATVAAAVRIIVAEDHADHIDLNFGCPVPKVTRKGGGAALPWKLDLFRQIVTGAVQAAGDV
ncbi:MAG: tRNA-dihydrouridine synthase, partial [Microbacterium sp.]|nr:tRNA-dihydrouridine synthase [Microbacterium sp.]